MMNKLTKKVAIAIAVGTMTIAATGAIAHASEIHEVETVDVSVDDCISYRIGGNEVINKVIENSFEKLADWVGSWFN